MNCSPHQHHSAKGAPLNPAFHGGVGEAMLSARPTLKAEHEKLHRALLTIVREDAFCRRLMTVPQKDVYSSVDAPPSASGL